MINKFDPYMGSTPSISDFYPQRNGQPVPPKRIGVPVQKPPVTPNQTAAPKQIGVPPHPDKAPPLQVQEKPATPVAPAMPTQPVAPGNAWQWQPGQPPQWPIKPPPKDSMPFEGAQMLQDRELAKRNPTIESNYIAPNYNTQMQGAFAPTPGSQEYGDYVEQSPESMALEKEKSIARNDLFKQYHGGWSPGEYSALQRQQQGQIGIPVMRGNAGGAGGESIAERDARLGREEATIGIERQKANAANLQAQAAMKSAESGVPERMSEYYSQHPELRLPDAAMKYGHPEGLAALPRDPNQPISPGNYSQQLQNYPDLARVMQNPNLKLHEKLGVLSKVPGAENPNHPIHQIIKSWLGEQLAGEQNIGELQSNYQTQREALGTLGGIFTDPMRFKHLNQRRQELEKMLHQFGHQFPTPQ
jgi:hypothetical protein